MSTTSSHEAKLIKFLVKELGGSSNVKRFSSELKDIGIDLSKTKTQEFIMSADGAPLLFSLVSYFTFGILSKITQIKGKINE